MLCRSRSTLLLICLTISFASFVAAQEKQSKDLFVITVSEKKGFIDKTGNIVIEPRFDQVQDFSGGIARVWINCYPCERRFIDKQGNFVRSSILDEGQQIEFHEGLAAVTVGEIPNYSYGFIDNRGNLIIQPQFMSTFRFSEGLARFAVGEKWGFIDKTGNAVISPQFDDVNDFSEGLASVEVDGLWGFIDKTGKIVISPQYKYAFGFSEGLANVQKNKKYGFIDKTGKIQIKFKFDETADFSEGLAAVVTNGKDQFIDKFGKIAIPIKFDQAKNFDGGLAEVSIGLPIYNNKSGYIDKTGKFIWINK